MIISNLNCMLMIILTIIKVKNTGCYFIVNNEYLRWSVIVPPLKHTNFRDEIRLSDWIESMRKDIECTFGIPKGRWWVLQYRIKLWGKQNTDKVWITYCGLHNWLLEVDGLAEGWEDGVQSNFDTEPDDICDIPFEISCLRAPESRRNKQYQLRGLSGMGCGNDIEIVSLKDDVIEVMSVENQQINSIKKSLQFIVSFVEN